MAEDQTKVQTSLASMKNASKHLTEILQANDRMNITMGSIASDLISVANKCGDLYVSAYVEGSWKPTSLKGHLNDLAKVLEKGRL